MSSSHSGSLATARSALGAPIKRIAKAYQWLVVDPFGNVWAGNEYQSDAKDMLAEIRDVLPAGSKVMARRTHARLYGAGMASGRSKKVCRTSKGRFKSCR